jgi:hypothetical protein
MIGQPRHSTNDSTLKDCSDRRVYSYQIRYGTYVEKFLCLNFRYVEEQYMVEVTCIKLVTISTQYLPEQTVQRVQAPVW